MKREIKFRGLDINNNWHIGNLAIVKEKINGFNSVDPGYYISNSKGISFAFQVRKETIGEFTGLHDKNGKEIFEGDILSFKDRVNSFVGFENGAFILDKIMPPRPLAERMLQYGDCEIIGNIYENKDLI